VVFLVQQNCQALCHFFLLIFCMVGSHATSTPTTLALGGKRVLMTLEGVSMKGGLLIWVAQCGA